MGSAATAFFFHTGDFCLPWYLQTILVGFTKRLPLVASRSHVAVFDVSKSWSKFVAAVSDDWDWAMENVDVETGLAAGREKAQGFQHDIFWHVCGH